MTDTTKHDTHLRIRALEMAYRFYSETHDAKFLGMMKGQKQIKEYEDIFALAEKNFNYFIDGKIDFSNL